MRGAGGEDMCHINCNANANAPDLTRPGGVVYGRIVETEGRERTEMESRQRTCLF